MFFYIKTQQYTIAKTLFGFGSDLFPITGKEKGAVCDTNRGLSREEIFPDVANFGTQGKRRDRAPPFRALGTNVMPLSSSPPHPHLPCFLSASGMCFESQTVYSIPQYLFNTVTLQSSCVYTIPNRSLFFQQEVNNWQLRG